MAKIFFKKELPKNRIYTAKGQPVPFEVLSGGYGVAVFDEETQAEAIDTCKAYIAKGIMGVSVIQEAEYLELKKKFDPSLPPKHPPQKLIRIFNPPGAGLDNQEPEAPARAAGARAAAPLAGETSSAPSAEEAELSPVAPVLSRGRPVRRGKPPKVAMMPAAPA